MKKLISILITLSFILASCSSDEPEDLTDSENRQEVTALPRMKRRKLLTMAERIFG